MKEILISIQPQWVEKILNGEKTLEIRKTMPKCEFPIKVYIYQTKKKWIYRILQWLGLWQGKIVAEFTLNKITELSGADVEIEKQSCLSIGELYKYANGKNLYAWHIDDLKIYDKPKELSEFGLKRAPQSWQYVKGGL